MIFSQLWHLFEKADLYELVCIIATLEWSIHV